jgi:hypothetical protein
MVLVHEARVINRMPVDKRYARFDPLKPKQEKMEKEPKDPRTCHATKKARSGRFMEPGKTVVEFSPFILKQASEGKH